MTCRETVFAVTLERFSLQNENSMVWLAFT